MLFISNRISSNKVWDINNLIIKVPYLKIKCISNKKISSKCEILSWRNISKSMNAYFICPRSGFDPLTSTFF